jgi:hypothetical protein
MFCFSRIEEGAMAFPKAPPRVKGPYAERGGTRFRVRICDAGGQRDLYFASRAEALDGMKQAERDLPPEQACRTLRAALDEHTQEKVRRGFCKLESANQHRARPDCAHSCFYRAACAAII